MWATGNQLKHKNKGNSSFSEENWGDSTLDYSSSIQQLQPPSWTRILAHTSKYKQSHKGNTIIQAVEGAASIPSIHASIIDMGQDDHDNVDNNNNSNSNNSQEDASDNGIVTIKEAEDRMEEFDDKDKDEKINANNVNKIVEDK